MVNRFARNVESQLSQEMRDAVGPEQLASITDNPNALIDPAARERILGAFDSLGERSDEVAVEFLEVLRAALAGAIGDIFTVALVVVLIAMGLTLFLKEIPLRSRGKPASAQLEKGDVQIEGSPVPAESGD